MIYDVDFSYKNPNLEWYQGEMNKEDIISLIYVEVPYSEMTEKPTFQLEEFEKRIKTGYIELGEKEGNKIVRRLRWLVGKVHFDKEYDLRSVACNGGFCCKKLQEPSTRCVTLIYHYETTKDEDDNVIVATPVRGKIKGWNITSKRYDELQRFERSFPFISHDFALKCTDVTYKKFALGPSKSECMWRQDPKVQEAVLAQIEREGLWQKVENALGRKYTEEELKEKMGIIEVKKAGANISVPSLSDEDAAMYLDTVLKK